MTVSVAALAACGGGGGSSSATSPAPRFNFVSFDEARDGTPQKARAEVRTVDATDPNALDGGSRFGTALFVLDGNQVRRAEFRGTGVKGTGGVGNNNAVFDEADGVNFAPADAAGFIVASGGTSANTLRVADPDAAGRDWNYQTFGLWERVNGTDRRIGLFSAGAETDVAGLPAAGGPTATYTGDLQLQSGGSGTAGDFSGRFYGPGAEETGGTMHFSTPLDTITAAFGAKRP